jgi:small conductance mechanosensitive channel
MKLHIMLNQILSQEFWTNIFRDAMNWLVTNAPSILIIVIVLLIALRLLNFSTSRLKKLLVNRAMAKDDDTGLETEKRINTLVGIVSGAGKVIIWLIFFMMVLKKFDVDIAPIIASAGIIGLAVGFGAQELVRDVISGFFILLENQIRAGDVAIINGTGGLVEKIELRTITLRDFSGVVHIFQNGKISTMSNMTKEWSAMVFDMGVAYKEDTDVVAEVMKQVGDELMNDEEFKDKFIEPIEIFGVDKFADSAVIVKARIKTKPIQQWTVGREYRRRLKKAFDEKGIEIPFPHSTIYWGEKIDPLTVHMTGQSSKN